MSVKCWPYVATFRGGGGSAGGTYVTQVEDGLRTSVCQIIILKEKFNIMSNSSRNWKM